MIDANAFIADVAEAQCLSSAAVERLFPVLETQQEAIFAQALADIRFARLCAEEQTNTVHVGVN